MSALSLSFLVSSFVTYAGWRMMSTAGGSAEGARAVLMFVVGVAGMAGCAIWWIV